MEYGLYNNISNSKALDNTVYTILSLGLLRAKLCLVFPFAIVIKERHVLLDV